MLYVVLLPWQLRRYFAADIKLVNENQCIMEWRGLLEIVASNRLILMNLS